MSDTPWPDPSRPGVPLNPERDGWHWINRLPATWDAERQWWVASHLNGHTPAWATRHQWRYGGPCYTPADLAARDDPQWDGTDAAHPAWWRGNDRGVEAVVEIINGVLDGATPGTYGSAALTELVRRIAARDAAKVREGEEQAVELIADYLEKCGLKSFWVRAVRRLAKPAAIRDSADGEEG